MMSRETEEKIQDLLDGRLEESDRLAVLEMLKDDPAALSSYCGHAKLESALRRMTAGGLEQEVFAEKLAQNALHRSKRRAIQWSAIAAAVLVALMLTILYQVMVPAPEPALTFRYSLGSQFVVEHVDSGDPQFESNFLEPGSRIKLTQGCVELNFKSGVRTVVHGPADLTLQEEDQLYLSHGKIWSRVPPKAVGFRVKTSEFLVTDLGTEFGVISARNDYDQVHVFEGRVSVEASKALKESADLEAGQSRLVDGGGRLKTIKNQPELFLKEMPLEIPSLYFSFDVMEGKRIPVGGSYPGVDRIKAELATESPMSASTTGVKGQALSLGPETGWVDTNWKGFTGKRSRSVAFWLRMPKSATIPPQLPAIVGWGTPTGANNKWKITMAPGSSPQELIPRLSFGFQRFDGGKVLNDGQWHHLVFVYRAIDRKDSDIADVKIYVDGQPDSATYRPHIEDEDNTFHGGPVNTLAGFPMRLGSGVAKFDEFFTGEIDELYLYEGAISEELVESLFSRISTHTKTESTNN